DADRAADRTHPGIAARLPRPGGVAGGPADRDAAFGLLDAGGRLGHPDQVGRDDARRLDERAAERHPARGRLTPKRPGGRTLTLLRPPPTFGPKFGRI